MAKGERGSIVDPQLDKPLTELLAQTEKEPISPCANSQGHWRTSAIAVTVGPDSRRPVSAQRLFRTEPSPLCRIEFARSAGWK